MSAASAAVGSASGRETMGSGLGPGCMWQYSCLSVVVPLLLVTLFQSHQQIKLLLLKLIIGVNC